MINKVLIRAYASLHGDCSGLHGDIDNCEITTEQRSAGININELVEQQKKD